MAGSDRSGPKDEPIAGSTDGSENERDNRKLGFCDRRRRMLSVLDDDDAAEGEEDEDNSDAAE